MSPTTAKHQQRVSAPKSESLPPGTAAAAALVHKSPQASAAVLQLAYLAQESRKDELVGIFQLLNDSTVVINHHRVLTCADFPCWRWWVGRIGYFGPVPFHPDDSPLVLGPGSMSLPEGESQASWTQEKIGEVWRRWSTKEQAIYVEVRLAGLEVAKQWCSVNGYDVDSFCSDFEIRLTCARFAAWAVSRYRGWRGEVQAARKEGA